MSLPACQERILGGIERALRTAEPRLTARFAMFTRLTRDEELPCIEQLVPQQWRPWRWLTRAGTAGCRVPFLRSPLGNGTPAWARPASRLRTVVVVPVVLIAMASALLVASFSGAARTCVGPPRHAAAVAARWGTCAASGAEAPGTGSGTSEVGGGR